MRSDVLCAGLAGLVLALGVACSGVPSLPDLEEGGTDFSPGLAAAHLEALSSLAPRWPGSREDLRARRYLVKAFEAAGARLVSAGEQPGDPLIAEVRGRSSDVVLLVAAYGALGSAEWVDDSGLALLIELARLYAIEAAPPYTVRFALAEVRPPLADSDEDAADDVGEQAWRSPDGPVEARQQVVLAGRGLAEALALNEEGEALRAVIAFEPRAEAGGRIARDLRSHPIFREVFWETADRLGYANTFPKDSGWSSTPGLHGAFGPLAGGRVLALVDERLARTELARPEPSIRPGTSTLEPIGRVTRGALGRLMRRFEKIDAFRVVADGHEARGEAHPELNETSD